MKLLSLIFFLLCSFRVEAILQVYPGESCSEVLAKNHGVGYEAFRSGKLTESATAYIFERLYEGHKSTIFFECNEKELFNYSYKVIVQNSTEARFILDSWHIAQLAELGAPDIDSRKSSKGTLLKMLKDKGIMHEKAQLITWNISGYSLVSLAMDEIDGTWFVEWSLSKS